MHDIRYDPVHDELLVTNPFAQAILVFRGGANGEEAPIRVIQGPDTLLGDNTDRADVDSVHNEIIVPNRESILVFPREASGNAAPIRILRGPNTHIRHVQVLAVDPVNNLIVANSIAEFRPGAKSEALLIFNRTDRENAAPRSIIAGSNTGLTNISQLQVHSAKGWIVAAEAGNYNSPEPEGAFVGVWSINDKGNVRARWKISGTKSTLKRPRGVVLDPENKELIVADMRLNAVLTYYFPEIF